MPYYRLVAVVNSIVLVVLVTVLFSSQAGTDDVIMLAPNTTPVAQAGFDQVTTEESLAARLNGSNSSDADDDRLSYFWAELSDPADACSLVDFIAAEPVVSILNRLQSYSCTFQLVVDDGRAESMPDEVTLFVTADNDVPVVQEIANLAASTDTAVTVDVRAQDPENQAVALTMKDASGQFTALGEDIDQYFAIRSNGSGLLYWQPDFTENGKYTFTVSASDGTTTDERDFTVTVSQANVAPRFTGALGDITLSLGNSTVTTIDLDDYFTDLNNETLTYAVAGADQVAVELNDGVVQLTGSAQPSTETIYFTASDNTGALASSNSITVNTVASTTAQAISYVVGKPRGQGMVTVVQTATDQTTGWLAFNQGGVMPLLVSGVDRQYVAALRNYRSRVLKLFSHTGTLLDEVRLAPSVDWKFVGTADFDGQADTVEVVLRGNRKQTVYLRVMQFSKTKPLWQVVTATRVLAVPVQSNYTITAKAVEITQTDGTVVHHWPVAL